MFSQPRPNYRKAIVGPYFMSCLRKSIKFSRTQKETDGFSGAGLDKLLCTDADMNVFSTKTQLPVSQSWKSTAVIDSINPVKSKLSAKHHIDLTVDDAEDDGPNCHKKRKDSRPEDRLEDSGTNNDDADPLFRHNASRPELMTSEKHPPCFTNKFLMLVTSTCQSKHNDYSLIFCPPRSLVGMSVHPLDLLQQTPRQFNVSGKAIIVSIDQYGLTHRFIKKKRLLPPRDLSLLKLSNGPNLYFHHAAWFLECTNLHHLPRKGIGMAIAVITDFKTNNLPLTRVELGVVLCPTREHFIYAIANDQIALDPETMGVSSGLFALKARVNRILVSQVHAWHFQWTLPDSNPELGSYSEYQKVCVPKSNCWTFNSLSPI
jgi:hypothetical protein